MSCEKNFKKKKANNSNAILMEGNSGCGRQLMGLREALAIFRRSFDLA
jgi:hypothetical protein